VGFLELDGLAVPGPLVETLALVFESSAFVLEALAVVALLGLTVVFDWARVEDDLSSDFDAFAFGKDTDLVSFDDVAAYDFCYAGFDGDGFLVSCGFVSVRTRSFGGDFDFDLSPISFLIFFSFSAFLRSAFSSLLFSGAGWGLGGLLTFVFGADALLFGVFVADLSFDI